MTKAKRSTRRQIVAAICEGLDKKFGKVDVEVDEDNDSGKEWELFFDLRGTLYTIVLKNDNEI